MEETKNINSKLAEIQKELKAPKDKTNSFGKYKYRSCESILEAVKPLLAGQLSLTLTDEIICVGENASQDNINLYDKDGKCISESVIGGARFYIKATATLSDGIDSVSVSACARESQDKKGMDDSQITGTASSYARKYALNGLFAIDDTKDADTDEFTNNNKNNQDEDDGNLATGKAIKKNNQDEEVF